MKLLLTFAQSAAAGMIKSIEAIEFGIQHHKNGTPTNVGGKYRGTRLDMITDWCCMSDISLPSTTKEKSSPLLTCGLWWNRV